MVCAQGILSNPDSPAREAIPFPLKESKNSAQYSLFSLNDHLAESSLQDARVLQAAYRKQGGDLSFFGRFTVTRTDPTQADDRFRSIFRNHLPGVLSHLSRIITEREIVVLFIGGAKELPPHALELRVDRLFHFVDPRFGLVESPTLNDLITRLMAHLLTCYPMHNRAALKTLSIAA